MSVVPLMFRDWWDDFERPMSRLMDQHFGSGLNREDLLSGLSSLSLSSRPRSIFAGPSYYRPWRNLVRHNSGGASTISCDKDRFEVILDVQQFSPEEITVKTVGNNVIVEAKHEEKQDEHGYISRHFVRKYVLPASHDTMGVTSSLSSDGVLTISAPKKNLNAAGTERIIDVVKTGVPSATKIDEKPEEKPKEKPKEHIITTEEA